MAKGQMFELLYGGAAGGGKSEWLLYHLHRMAIRFPGFSGLLIRRSFGELEKTAILRSHARFDRKVCRYQAQHKRWVFDNGSIIHFGFCDSDADVFQYDSFEADVVAWDELTQFPTDYPYRYLFSRVRTSIGKSIRGLTPHVIAGTNPHRTGVAWVKPRWVDLGGWEDVHIVKTEMGDGTEREMARVFIPAKIDDNRYIDKAAYLQGLVNLDEATRRAMEDGSWDAIEGQYFTEWSRPVHVIKPFPIPTWWRRIGGLDFGIAAPFCHLWLAFDGDGTGYVYREVYGPGLTPQQQVDLIRSQEPAGERIDYRVADPSIWTRSGAGPPIAQQYLERGMPFRKANNARVDGWARLRDYLRLQIPNEDPDTGVITLKPRLYFFETCQNIIRTLPLMVHDAKKPEDVDTDGEDHTPDTLRYALMSRPLRSLAPAPTDPRLAAELARRRQVRQEERGVHDHPTLGTLEM